MRSHYRRRRDSTVASRRRCRCELGIRLPYVKRQISAWPRGTFPCSALAKQEHYTTFRTQVFVDRNQENVSLVCVHLPYCFKLRAVGTKPIIGKTRPFYAATAYFFSEQKIPSYNTMAYSYVFISAVVVFLCEKNCMCL